MTTALYAAAAGVLTAAAALISGTGIPIALLLATASAAAMTDARELRIPNTLSLAAAITALAVWAGAGAPVIALLVAGIAAVTLLWLWHAELCGGGDVKYLPWLVLAAAALGDPHLALARVLVIGVLLLGMACLWPRGIHDREGPVVVGGALALAVAVGL